jgi:TolA-binding protein
MPSATRVALLAALLLPAWASPGADPASRREREAAEYFRAARSFEARGETAAARAKMERLVKLYPDTGAAAAAQFEVAKLYHAAGEYENAFMAYQAVVESYPASPRFNNVLQGQFEIASDSLARIEYRRRYPETTLPAGIPKPPVIREMLETLIANAKQSEFAPRARLLLAASYQATEDEEDRAKEILAALIDAHPESEWADDAGFQIAYIDYKKGTAGGIRRGALVQARLGFEEFLLKFPGSDKAPVAKHLIEEIDRDELRYLYGTASYYEGRGKPDAAAIYYGEALKLLQNIGPAKLPPDLKAASEKSASRGEALLRPEGGGPGPESPGPPALIRNRTTGEEFRIE